MSDDQAGAARPADGSRRLYILWGAGLAVLALLKEIESESPGQ